MFQTCCDVAFPPRAAGKGDDEKWDLVGSSGQRHFAVRCCCRLNFSVAPGKAPFEAAQDHFLEMYSTSSPKPARTWIRGVACNLFFGHTYGISGLPLTRVRNRERGPGKDTSRPRTQPTGKPESRHGRDIVTTPKKILLTSGMFWLPNAPPK